mmetsp:Transcript_28080/g.77229  ORF Transcript_28080/g.77229 Transcript_28080/m.77229 type:complete len:281 (-) Transcript_28080:1392-2234(-)
MALSIRHVVTIVLGITLILLRGGPAGMTAHGLLPQTTSFFLARHEFVSMVAFSPPSLLVGGLGLDPNTSPDPQRSVDVGGGLNLLQTIPPTAKDAFFPKSVEGVWNCQRQVISLDGDAFMAETCWKALGGDGKAIKSHEVFPTRFLLTPDENYCVLDRGFELQSRKPTAKNIQYTRTDPNHLEYNGNIQISVVRRTIEPPNDAGFGYQEFLAIQDGPFVLRGCLIKRRYRRNFAPDGQRILEGLEIAKTFRVLDGVAGTEFPTSTLKSTLLLTASSSGVS